MLMTVDEILQHKFGLDFGKVLLHHGPSGVEAALRSELHKAAEKALHLGSPCGGNEVELADLAYYMGLLSAALHGQGSMEVED
jgi:hypothetical protein